MENIDFIANLHLQRTMLPKHLDISSRKVTYWKERDILPFFTKEKHAKMNIPEAVWLYLINELASLGIDYKHLAALAKDVWDKPRVDGYLDRKLEMLINSPFSKREDSSEIYENLKQDDLLKKELAKEINPFTDGIIESISTPDPYKAIIKLSKSDATFLTKLDSKWCSMAPKHILESQDIPNSSYNNAPVGTGPFKFVEWKKGSHIIFERNKDYWAKAANGDQLPYLDKLYFKILPNKTSLISSLEAREIDFIHSYPGYLAGKEIARVNNANNGIKVHSFAYANMAFDFIYDFLTL